MATVQERRPGPLPWDELRYRLDERLPFTQMRGTPYFHDAVYEQFSRDEYARRYAALREKMRELNLDCLIVCGGPNHWSYGAGMLWLTGHWEWHAVSNYVVVPLEGEPTLVYSMGGTHIESVRREVSNALSDVRHSRGGRFAEVIVERINELGLERSRIGLTEIDPRFGDYLPVNQYNTLRQGLPDVELVFTKDVIHELVTIHSEEELDCIRKAGQLCQKAMDAIIETARPGITERQLEGAAASAILSEGGQLDFLIIASSPQADPSMIFGNPRPSGRVLQDEDFIVMELAAGYRGYTAQIGSPVCVGRALPETQRFFDEIVLPGYKRIVAELTPGKKTSRMSEAGSFFRGQGAQSRPILVHGIDFTSSMPHINVDHTEDDVVLQPGMVFVVEPNPARADGLLGMFFGHTYIVTANGNECVDQLPWELHVAK